MSESEVTYDNSEIEDLPGIGPASVEKLSAVPHWNSYFSSFSRVSSGILEKSPIGSYPLDATPWSGL
ncbi:MAG: hypothetical protein JRN54_07970 [Nitrososphaerota archaeon]|nr:hypothetical protein [Nitrososphaerota archaeon]